MRAWTGPRGYLGVLILGAAALQMLDVVAPAASIASLSANAVAAAAVVVAALFLGLRCQPGETLTRSQQVFVVAGFATWALATGLVLSRGAGTQPALLILGLLMGLAILRPPSPATAEWAMGLLVGSVVVVSVVALIMEATGLRASWYVGLMPADLLDYERGAYWIPLADLVGVDGRWAGPFDHPGRAGMAGAIVLVWGAARSGLLRPVFLTSGVAMVLLAGSSTGYLAAVAGLAVIAAAWAVRRVPGMPAWVTAALPLAGLAAFVMVVVGANSSLSGRTEIWPTYLELWQGSPWVGVGEVGIAQALVSEDLPTWAYHAHNSWLDLLARYGVVVLMAALVALVGALVTTAARAISGAVAPLAILITLLVGSIAQPILTWTLPTMWVTALVLVVLAAGPAPSRTDAPAAGGDSSRLGRLPWRA